MAQTGFTPIQLYFSSTTTNVPLAANLASGELAINITDGKLFYKDNANAVQVIAWKITPTSAGGTGLTSYTAGDMVYYASGTALSKLAIGTTDYVMTSSGSAPQWSASLKAIAGGTGQTSYAVGDLLYANTTTTLAKLADVATGNALISGGVSTAPSWGKIGLTTHVSGTLPVANGGTGTATAFTAGSVVFAGASGVYSQDNANLFFDDTNNRLGVGTVTPDTLLHVLGAATTDGSISYVNQLTATTAYNASPLVGTQVSLKYNAGGSYAGMGGWTIGKENATDGNFASYFAIHTRANGGAITEKLRVSSLGFVGLGCTPGAIGGDLDIIANQNGVGIGYSTSVYRRIVTQSTNVLSFISGSNTATLSAAGAWTNASDARLKKNITEIKYGLDTVMASQPRSYNRQDVSGDFIGFVAQELKTLVPEVVFGSDDEQYTVDYGSLVAIAFKAIQELKAEIEILKGGK
jgi:hypothetical protein